MNSKRLLPYLGALLAGFTAYGDLPVASEPTGLLAADQWQALKRPEPGYYQGDIHATRTAGDSVGFSFNGTGIALLSEKFNDLGAVEVFLDGRSRGIINLRQDDFPRLVQIKVFSEQGLPLGPHRIRLVNQTAAWFTVDAFTVSGGPPPQRPDD